MPDERLDSMKQGLGAPPESDAAQRADAERRAAIAQNPVPVEMEGAMGGTSDADRPGDEAAVDAALRRGLPDEKSAVGGEDDRMDAGGDRAQTLRETREAGLRAQGGGSSDEQDIRQAARPEQR